VIRLAVYSYITPTLTELTGMAEVQVPLVLSVIAWGWSQAACSAAGWLIAGRC
jgi:predicted MFS family arabinose efflux permease